MRKGIIIPAAKTPAPAFPSSVRLVGWCWLLMQGIVGVVLLFQVATRGWGTVSLCAVLWTVLLGVTMLSLRLVRDQATWAMPWHLASSIIALAALDWFAPETTAVWLLFPLSAVISVICFAPRVARLHGLLLMLTLLAVQVGGHGLDDLPEKIVAALFTPILSYLIERSRRRESQLAEEIAVWADEADAVTTISWSLTGLTPSEADIAAILERACPPHVSLALMRLNPASNCLITDAAVGPDAAAMRKWSYQMRPESTSIVAQALRERRILSASIRSDNALLLFAGALPSTAQILRSAAVLPIMRQGAAPLGVLLALSSQTEAVGRAHHLGILPAVANQFAVALENAQLFSEAQARADHDAMTGLYHHRAINQRLQEEVGRANRSAAPFAVLMIDLDRFRLYNDTYGHQLGDRILIRSATALRQHLRPTDILGRYGGDEFMAILPDTDPAEARQVAQRLAEAFAAEDFRPQEGAERMPLTLSIGVALFPNDGATAQDLAARADAAMSEAHHSGGNRVDLAQRPDGEPTHGRAIDLRGFGILESLVTAVDHKDRYTKEHSEEVATYAQLLAEALQLPPSRSLLLFDAGLLHDVGKVGVPDAVLRKPGRLTEEEMAAMRQHVVLSEALLRCLLPADTDPDVLDAVRFHHERWDGKGYPYGLAGEDVPLIGRIMIVADATSAMHMDRPYRRGLSPAQIVKELRRGAGSQFDPALVEPFIAAFMHFHNLTETDLAPPPTTQQHSAA